MESIVPRDRSISDLLSRAASADLEVLADLITDSGKGRIALDSDVKGTIMTRKVQGRLQSISGLLEKEICAFGSNTIVSAIKSESINYLEVATGVAKKLDGKPSAQDDIFAIEEIIIRQAVDKYMGDEALKDYLSGGNLAGYINEMVKTLMLSAGSLGGMATTGGGAGFASALGGRVLSMVAAPLAIGAAGLAIYQASSPAFRITIPAVLHVAKLRRARYDQDFEVYTEKLKACL
ncbi:hypothetical protein [Pseudomonas psychrophila]|uniref:Uncharacterized protein YaaW, UPF0174 family n=1 Tax=Pseudomonas psychrophila TaxID=122355 RepID=A0ABY0VXZ0_9PSED|nr:hypothetical protein [Pseudomonas psychrophila]KMM98490.1 hypothetical protein TU76_16560 [Pseudomonas psychrophila]SDU62577.1 Uncharacterized protein YaaW, UPF0174 family [Pseudomonas psychrophila]